MNNIFFHEAGAMMQPHSARLTTTIVCCTVVTKSTRQTIRNTRSLPMVINFSCILVFYTKFWINSENVTAPLGQRENLSNADIRRLNARYCSNVTTEEILTTTTKSRKTTRTKRTTTTAPTTSTTTETSTGCDPSLMKPTCDGDLRIWLSTLRINYIMWLFIYMYA